MQLPKYKKKKRIKLKVCQEPGCSREFWGHPIAKYCELHRDIKQRQKIKKSSDSLEMRNMFLRHNYSEPVDATFKCCLENCNNSFNVRLYPKQYVYPRFCIQHRNDFQRENFVRLNKRKNSESSEVD